MVKNNILALFIILVTILSPWFWHIKPVNLFELSIEKDIKSAKQIAHEQRADIKNNSFSRIFVNWPTVFLKERINIIMENLDISNYFFSGHPRERVGVFEIQKFFFFQFILLLIGFSNPKIRSFGKFLIIYSLVVLCLTFIFKWREFDKSLLLAPPLILIMALGFEKIFNLQKKWITIFSLLMIFEVLSGLIFYSKGLLQ